MEYEFWQQQAECRDNPDLQFPGKDEYAIEAAKKVCRRCPVQMQCLQWALEKGEEFGVWGATSERERRRMRFRKPA